jgi:hypothetical protein
MSDRQTVDLYELLPALYRLEDTEQGYPLRALLEVIAEQAGIIKRDIDGLWDDYFIETCSDWVVPYIGDLVANNPLHEVGQRRRTDVARTISYRRRKGTLPMLEELARNVTGWGAHAVAFFELLGWTQNLNHLRYQITSDPEDHPDAVDQVGTVNLRDPDVLDRLDGPFDIVSHTVDVRTTRRAEGWHNIRKVGFFLWRLRRYALGGVTPCKSTNNTYGYHFSPLGNCAPLFTAPQVEMDETGLAREIHVPGPIRPRTFRSNPGEYYGRGLSLRIVSDGVPVPLAAIVCMDLRDWEQPKPGTVAVDVRLGRLAFAEGEEPEKLEVSYNYGFSADIGGGPYRRRRPQSEPGVPDTLANPDVFGVSYRVPSTGIESIKDALDEWNEAGRPRAVIHVDDSRTYEENLSIDVADTELVIQAADRQRPLLRGGVTIPGGTDDARLVLSGLLIEGGVEVQGGLGELSIEHCTLVPGRRLGERGRPHKPDRPSVIVGAANRRLRLEIDHSIVGPLRVPPDMVGLRVKDSIIDSPTRDRKAKVVPALVSDSLPRHIRLSSEKPAVRVTIGDEGPHKAVLRKEESEESVTVARARKLLQEAIRTARHSPVLESTRVLTDPIERKRLIVLPGAARTVTIEADASTPGTASELGLDHDSGRQVYALISGPLPSSVELTSEEPAVRVTIGNEGPYRAILDKEESEGSVTVARARKLLQKAIRAAHHSPAFKEALVTNRENQLIVIPGTEGTAVSFRATSTNRKTLTELALESDRPAIAASAGGELPGPPATLERTTVFGTVHVRELSLASEVIFTAPVTAVRRQAGCVRFSYVPNDSRTPRRYRCQPDLALAQRAQEMHLKPGYSLPPPEKELIQFRLQPVFTSVHYGDPAYAQLGFGSAEELRTGAEDGSEMGAFCHLKQPQREANLRLRLEEYLPFGLEAGFIYVT